MRNSTGISGQPFLQASQITHGERRRTGAVGNVIKWFDTNGAAVAIAAQCRQDGAKLHLTLTRRAPVWIVELDVANQASGQPAINQIGNALSLAQTGSAAINHGA